MQAQDKIIIFTDGSSFGNPGPGGWGAVILFQREDNVVEIGGNETHTTNNKMELSAAIESLQAVKDKDGDVVFHTDSTYLMDGITKWIHNWIKRGWKTADKKEVLNQDLWQRLFMLKEEREKKWKIYWKKVPAHSGVLANERADTVATSFAEKRDVTFAHGTLEEYEKLFQGKFII